MRFASYQRKGKPGNPEKKGGSWVDEGLHHVQLDSSIGRRGWGVLVFHQRERSPREGGGSRKKFLGEKLQYDGRKRINKGYDGSAGSSYKKLRREGLWGSTGRVG